MIVVVIFVRGEHQAGVASVDDEDPVEQFAANAPDEALGDRALRKQYRGPVGGPTVLGTWC
jgi:hypothetical protein